jgi:hypothetical protein
MRWLTAEVVTCNCSAAASKLPNSITAANAAGLVRTDICLIRVAHPPPLRHLE